MPWFKLRKKETLLTRLLFQLTFDALILRKDPHNLIRARDSILVHNYKPSAKLNYKSTEAPATKWNLNWKIKISNQQQQKESSNRIVFCWYLSTQPFPINFLFICAYHLPCQKHPIPRQSQYSCNLISDFCCCCCCWKGKQFFLKKTAQMLYIYNRFRSIWVWFSLFIFRLTEYH